MNDSNITVSRGSIGFNGEDAVKLYQATLLVSSLKMWAKHKMIPTRGVTITKMLKLATTFTGIPYRRCDADRAAADVQIWADNMKLALPVIRRD
jgi:hypothetical protein